MLPIDLRSDTVTRPTPAMRQAMAQAQVGDDVFGEDPAVNQLEERLARMFGHEAALFCPSGTMSNQIALRVHTRPGDEVICDEGAHIYLYEGGGTMANNGCSVKLIHGNRGRFTAQQVEAALNDPANVHLPRSRVVSVENTSNRGGGSVWAIGDARHIRSLCNANGIALHMDGARIFNAMAVDGTSPAEWGALFDSISVCLSKGLGAPVGSVLTGPAAFIAEARRVRKRMGGGMRQAGILAAAGLYALDHHVQRLPEDHRRAKELADLLRRCALVEQVMPVETNIVVAYMPQAVPEKTVVDKLAKRGVLASRFGPHMIRMVTHLDVNDEAMDRAKRAISTLN